MASRRKKSEEGGAPGWIVTFSDLMSLLLTFFVLLLSFSTISEDAFNEAMMSLQGALGVLDRLTHVVSVAPRPQRKQAQEMEDAARRLRRQLQVMGKQNQVKVEYDAAGGIKISLPDSILFDQGSATLKPAAYPVLEDVAAVLSELPDTFIEVRGHTDATPLTESSTYEDNHQLSYFRAEAVTRTVHQFGDVPMEQFEIIACGPSQPMASNTTAEGRRANRRVDVFVRGLVDESTMDKLEESMRRLGAPEIPDQLPVSPRELDELR